LFSPFFDRAMKHYPAHYPVAGADELERADLDTIFPQCGFAH